MSCASSVKSAPCLSVSCLFSYLVVPLMLLSSSPGYWCHSYLPHSKSALLAALIVFLLENHKRSTSAHRTRWETVGGWGRIVAAWLLSALQLLRGLQDTNKGVFKTVSTPWEFQKCTSTQTDWNCSQLKDICGGETKKLPLSLLPKHRNPKHEINSVYSIKKDNWNKIANVYIFL